MDTGAGVGCGEANCAPVVICAGCNYTHVADSLIAGHAVDNPIVVKRTGIVP